MIWTESYATHIEFAYELNLVSDTVSICLLICDLSLKSNAFIYGELYILLLVLFFELGVSEFTGVW